MLLVAAWVLAAPVSVELAPASTLARAVADGVGAVVHQLEVVTDGSVTAEERGALLTALERSGLFELVEGDAPAALHVSRASAGTVAAVVEGRAGQRLWAGDVPWPASAPEPAPNLDEATRQSMVLRWQSERVRVMAAERSYVHAPFSDPRDADFFASASRAGQDSGDWAMSYTGSPPVTTLPDDWVIVRGGGEVIDDLRLAQLLDDDKLVRRIEEERFWPQVWWSAGFGTAAVATVTTGALLARSDEDDTRTVGISLLTAGVVAAALALLTPLLEPEHVLTATEARGLAEAHNERLRKSLGLTPDDVRD